MTGRIVTYQCARCGYLVQREAVPDYGAVYLPDMWYCGCCGHLALFNAIPATTEVDMTAIGIPDNFEDDEDDPELEAI